MTLELYNSIESWHVESQLELELYLVCTLVLEKGLEEILLIGRFKVSIANIPKNKVSSIYYNIF